MWTRKVPQMGMHRLYQQKLDYAGDMDKHSSLLRTFANHGRKKFYNIGG